LTGLRVLVAEDNLVNQRVVQLMLRKHGCSPDFVVNGLDALDAVERREYDAILMDCQMPVLDGYEATRRLRNDPRFRDLHIIAMTANSMEGDRERCLASGMDDYLAKPTREADLVNALVKVRAARPPAS
jgi:CheY-like chemotaxis protein